MSTGSRKTVTIIFVDLVDSTRLGEALDPEPLGALMLRYFDAVADVLRRHGGSVEKFIGDAVMAVFGLPSVHEDDALRAVRAAIEVRDAIARLSEEVERERDRRIEAHIAVNTGEVFAGEAEGSYTLVTGDAVNVAARLQHAAAPGEILIGDATWRLVRDAVAVESTEPLSLRGKDDLVPAWRLLDIVGAPDGAHRFESPFVGRRRELAQLRLAYEGVVAERTNCLFTILGAAGIGKSRLVAEFAASLPDARFVAGRCVAYGEGVTFWPLREIVDDLTGSAPDASIAALLADDDDAESIAARISGAVGRSDVAVPTEEVFWGVRRLFESLARERPLVVVFEDIHWAAPTLLDLIDHVAEWSRDAPILLLCLARPELLELRPTWGGGKRNTSSLVLDTLSDEEAGALIDALAGGADLAPTLRAQTAAKAEGNPLFVEQMVALLTENVDVEVPPTIQAILAARLDRLTEPERIVLEHAAVVGTRFWSSTVEELGSADLRAQVPALLTVLVKKELIRPDEPAPTGSAAYRFSHILIRDATYAALAKERRADLHERFAVVIEAAPRAQLADAHALIGYHLEQAYRYRLEIAPWHDELAELAARAADHLAIAARRAIGRGDIAAATQLLGRTAALVPADAPERVELVTGLGAALVLAGDLREADAVLREAIDAAAAAGNRRIELHARLERAFVETLTSPERGLESLQRSAVEAIAELQAFDDHVGLANAWRKMGDVHWMLAQWVDQESALARALSYAERAGETREIMAIRMRLSMALYWGPTPAAEAIARAERMLEDVRGAHAVESTFLVCLAGLHAMSDRFDEARQLLDRGEAFAEELGFKLWFGGFSLVSGDVELLAGDPVAAERRLRRGYRLLDELGERRVLSAVASHLASALFLQGRYEEAEQAMRTSDQLGGGGVIQARIENGLLAAKLAARRGDVERAEALARAAVELAGRSDDISGAGTALLGLAAIVRTSDSDEATTLVARARDLFEQKGNVVAARAAGAALAGQTSGA